MLHQRPGGCGPGRGGLPQDLQKRNLRRGLSVLALKELEKLGHLTRAIPEADHTDQKPADGEEFQHRISNLGRPLVPRVIKALTPSEEVRLEQQSMVLTGASDDDLLDMARHWYGYGRWEAKYWFIGPEPGQPEGDNPHGDNLKKRCKAWIDLGRGELVDCKDHHFGFGFYDWHRETPPPKLQPTWKQLIRLLLAARSGKRPDVEDIRSYQQKRWGMKNGETCVIELCSLAANNLKAKKGVNFDPNDLLKERVKAIREKIHQYQPALVIMYRARDKSNWEEISGQTFSAAPDICTVGNGPTQAVFANHPVDNVGVDPEYWLKLAERLRRECALSVP